MFIQNVKNVELEYSYLCLITGGMALLLCIKPGFARIQNVALMFGSIMVNSVLVKALGNPISNFLIYQMNIKEG
jgi:hypothetical protein